MKLLYSDKQQQQKINYYYCIFGNAEKGQLGAKCQLCQNNHSVVDLTLLIIWDSMITVCFRSPGIHEPRREDSRLQLRFPLLQGGPFPPSPSHSFDILIHPCNSPVPPHFTNFFFCDHSPFTSLLLLLRLFALHLSYLSGSVLLFHFLSWLILPSLPP